MPSPEHGKWPRPSERRLDEDTVFRIGSISKTITAITVMQLWEQGPVDLDACASTSSRAPSGLTPITGSPTLGQIVEDVSGLPLGRYFRERLLAPSAWRALTSSGPSGCGPHPSPHRIRAALQWTQGGRRSRDYDSRCGSVYSTTSDMARYVAAPLGGGANEHGSVLRPVARLFELTISPIPGYRAWAWGFSRRGRGTSDRGSRRDMAVGHRRAGATGSPRRVRARVREDSNGTADSRGISACCGRTTPAHRRTWLNSSGVTLLRNSRTPGGRRRSAARSRRSVAAKPH